MLVASRDREIVRRRSEIPVGDVRLGADLTIPARSIGWVVFAHGSGSSRLSPRNLGVAADLNCAAIATKIRLFHS